VVCNLGTVNSSIVSSTTSVPAAAATVTIVVAATTQVLPASGLQTNNSATLTLPSSSVPFTAQHAQGAAQINDFTVSATPAVTPTVITAGSQSGIRFTIVWLWIACGRDLRLHEWESNS
jgi:hypothetical protein